ncbi:histidine phosphatase family protein [Bacillus sp. BRMEA1]|uniref:histidine phosphatase family protein n=1 Tax=Neobacillus endophyticus TaxID=2738405 RepID=UPI0015658D30|nr:histidine phosphatase family protein [Neobacillus endophyticus]NRD79219.1 histidine phosphatase family protein [Neobacillus endophyticus]
MQVTLIRHLPTEWNKKTWLQGRKDIGLTDVSEEIQKGIDTNKEILRQLSPFDIVLVSTLKRTHQTAHLYGYKGETECLLDELDFGPYEGSPKKELVQNLGEMWIHQPKELVLGESLKDFEKRLILFLKKYKDFRNILVFGHGAWIRGILSYLQYGDINHMNKILFNNNECTTIIWNSDLEK